MLAVPVVNRSGVEEDEVMAGPVLAALAAIPWTTILKQAPVLIAAARGVQASLSPPPPPLRADADIQTLRDRIVQLEATQQQHARLVSQLAGHVAQLATLADAAQRLCRRAMLVGATGLGFGVLACLLAWLL